MIDTTSFAFTKSPSSRCRSLDDVRVDSPIWKEQVLNDPTFRAASDLECATEAVLANRVNDWLDRHRDIKVGFSE